MLEQWSSNEQKKRKKISEELKFRKTYRLSRLFFKSQLARINKEPGKDDSYIEEEVDSIGAAPMLVQLSISVKQRQRATAL